MRTLRHPGPADPVRIESAAGAVHQLAYTLQPGLTLNEALTRPLLAAGMTAATMVFEGGMLDPLAYVIPAPAPDAAHVAYFSTPHHPAGKARVERANATFGFRDGAPFVHVHAVWAEPAAGRRGGHVLPHETTVATPARVRAWATPDVRIEAVPDAETNFTLFRPAPNPTPGGPLVVARIRPNVDFCQAVDALCGQYGMEQAVIRGSVGSLVGARFTDGRMVDDVATEVLVVDGRRGAPPELLIVDMHGRVHQGRLQPGENAVCITFELFLQPL